MSSYEKCPSCGSNEIETRRGTHHFRESGLDNVYLLNVEMHECRECGERVVSFSNLDEVSKQIGAAIVLKPGKLTGKEIKFFRSSLYMKAADFARILGIDKVTLSRWENDHEKVTKAMDRLIRLVYSLEAGIAASVTEGLSQRLREEGYEAGLDYFVPVGLSA